jgi:hypothetical protein
MENRDSFLYQYYIHNYVKKGLLTATDRAPNDTINEWQLTAFKEYSFSGMNESYWECTQSLLDKNKMVCTTNILVKTSDFEKCTDDDINSFNEHFGVKMNELYVYSLASFDCNILSECMLFFGKIQCPSKYDDPLCSFII